MPVPHHSVFTGQMPFLPPNQQHQSTEGNIKDIHRENNFKSHIPGFTLINQCLDVPKDLQRYLQWYLEQNLLQARCRYITDRLQCIWHFTSVLVRAVFQLNLGESVVPSSTCSWKESLHTVGTCLSWYLTSSAKAFKEAQSTVSSQGTSPATPHFSPCLYTCSLTSVL